MELTKRLIFLEHPASSSSATTTTTTEATEAEKTLIRQMSDYSLFIEVGSSPEHDL